MTEPRTHLTYRTRRPASADRTARAANFRRGGTYRRRRTL